MPVVTTALCERIGRHKWFAVATFEMEDSEVEWLRNLLSADTVIMRFEGTDYSKFDYTWTGQDRQVITDIIDIYNLLKAVIPEVREKALRTLKHSSRSSR